MPGVPSQELGAAVIPAVGELAPCSWYLDHSNLSGWCCGLWKLAPPQLAPSLIMGTLSTDLSLHKQPCSQPTAPPLPILCEHLFFSLSGWGGNKAELGEEEWESEVPEVSHHKQRGKTGRGPSLQFPPLPLGGSIWGGSVNYLVGQKGFPEIPSHWGFSSLAFHHRLLFWFA